MTRRYDADVCPNQAVSSEGYPSKKKTDQYVETSLTGCSKSLVQITNVRPLFFIKTQAVSPKEIKCRGSTVCKFVGCFVAVVERTKTIHKSVQDGLKTSSSAALAAIYSNGTLMIFILIVVS